MTTLSMETLLAAVVLLAGDQRQVREATSRGPAAESLPAREGAKDRTGARPNEGPERQADQRPGAGGDPGVANPFAPTSELSAMRIPSAQTGPTRGAPLGNTLSMPANPFTAIPRGSTATRPPAVYGMPPGPAPAVGGGGKAFSDYRPSSPISPYMALYAPPTPGLDNYNAYVRPQLEQRAFNQQVQSNFGAVQSVLGLPDMTPRSLQQVPQLYPIGPGVSGASFMNYQNYYPSYSGSR